VTEHVQLTLDDVDQVADDATAAEVEFGTWLRSLPPAPWRAEERDE
jgi:hypothetical protein